MTAVVVTWVLWNTVGPEDLRPDFFPFIFLTLLLSLQASYAAPLILLAQNRQTDRERIQYQEDRQRTERLLADSDYSARWQRATTYVANCVIWSRTSLPGWTQSRLSDG
jgi:uncharacterized membrane protein